MHKLVLEPRDDIRAWLKFSSIARRSGRTDLAKRIIIDLIGHDPNACDDAQVGIN